MGPVKVGYDIFLQKSEVTAFHKMLQYLIDIVRLMFQRSSLNDFCRTAIMTLSLAGILGEMIKFYLKVIVHYDRLLVLC